MKMRPNYFAFIGYLKTGGGGVGGGGGGGSGFKRTPLTSSGSATEICYVNNKGTD